MNELDYQLKVQKEVADELNLKEKVKRLQEQLNEANNLIKCYNARELDYTTDDGEVKKCGPAIYYLEKWGVK